MVNEHGDTRVHSYLPGYLHLAVGGRHVAYLGWAKPIPHVIPNNGFSFFKTLVSWSARCRDTSAMRQLSASVAGSPCRRPGVSHSTLMRPSQPPLDLVWQEQAIESKRNLLAYLRSKPKNLTMESFICLTELLRKAGWQHADEHWSKDDFKLSTVAAAEVELERQIAADKDRVLRQTVKTYRKCAG